MSPLPIWKLAHTAIFWEQGFNCPIELNIYPRSRLQKQTPLTWSKQWLVQSLIQETTTEKGFAYLMWIWSGLPYCGEPSWHLIIAALGDVGSQFLFV